MNFDGSNQLRKSTLEDVAIEIFSMTLKMKGLQRDQLECTLQTLVNILRDKDEPMIR